MRDLHGTARAKRYHMNDPMLYYHQREPCNYESRSVANDAYLWHNASRNLQLPTPASTAPLDRIYYLDRWIESIKSSSHPPNHPDHRSHTGTGKKKRSPPPMKCKQRRNDKKLEADRMEKTPSTRLSVLARLLPPPRSIFSLCHSLSREHPSIYLAPTLSRYIYIYTSLLVSY